MQILEIILIVVVLLLVVLIVVILNRKRKHHNRNSDEDEEIISRRTAREESFQVHSANNGQCNINKSDFLVETPVEKEMVEKQLSNLHKPPKPNTVPTFARAFNAADDTYESENPRFEVMASVKTPVDLPANFSAIKEWGAMIIGVYDQERCGSCWAFAVSSSFTDRIRIKSKGKYLANGDYLSPFHLAACIKCGKDNACPRVCEGNYLDDVMQYCVDKGAYAQSDIDKYAAEGESTQYVCIDLESNGVNAWKGSKKYRVNVLPPGQLNTPSNLKLNERAIMEEIYKNGTIACIFKVYVPQDKRNFYLYESGIYGYGWTSEPTETDGYHAINIVGWGEDIIDGKTAKYWIIRNSWGSDWGTNNGFAKILRGENFGMIEADCWAIEPQFP